jgi:hypothetical protein
MCDSIGDWLRAAHSLQASGTFARRQNKKDQPERAAKTHERHIARYHNRIGYGAAR